MVTNNTVIASRKGFSTLTRPNISSCNKLMVIASKQPLSLVLWTPANKQVIVSSLESSQFSTSATLQEVTDSNSSKFTPLILQKGEIHVTTSDNLVVLYVTAHTVMEDNSKAFRQGLGESSLASFPLPLEIHVFDDYNGIDWGFYLHNDLDNLFCYISKYMYTKAVYDEGEYRFGISEEGIQYDPTLRIEIRSYPMLPEVLNSASITKYNEYVYPREDHSPEWTKGPLLKGPFGLDLEPKNLDLITYSKGRTLYFKLTKHKDKNGVSIYWMYQELTKHQREIVIKRMMGRTTSQSFLSLVAGLKRNSLIKDPLMKAHLDNQLVAYYFPNFLNSNLATDIHNRVIDSKFSDVTKGDVYFHTLIGIAQIFTENIPEEQKQLKLEEYSYDTNKNYLNKSTSINFTNDRGVIPKTKTFYFPYYEGKT